MHVSRLQDVSGMSTSRLPPQEEVQGAGATAESKGAAANVGGETDFSVHRPQAPAVQRLSQSDAERIAQPILPLGQDGVDVRGMFDERSRKEGPRQILLEASVTDSRDMQEVLP